MLDEQEQGKTLLKFLSFEVDKIANGLITTLSPKGDTMS